MAGNKKDIPVVEKKSWYNDRYEFVSVQRNFLALIALFALVLSLVATFSVSQLAPLKTVEPFVIQVDQKTGVTQVVDPVKSREITGNEAVNQYFVVQYCRARESFLGAPDRNYYNYALVHILSEQPVFVQYQQEIALSNPDSPGMRLGSTGSREIHIASIKLLDKRKEGKTSTDILRYLVKAQVVERTRNSQTKVSQKLILIEFKYVELELSLEDRYLNPMGFQVTSYRVDDDSVMP